MRINNNLSYPSTYLVIFFGGVPRHRPKRNKHLQDMREHRQPKRIPRRACQLCEPL